jgi:spermidine/putrescine transport system substrate-binding protein
MITIRTRTALLAASALALTAGGALAQSATPESTPEAAALAPWVCPEGFEGQTLGIYNWSSYIADDTVANFEAACGVSTTFDTYVSNEEMLTKLRQGNPGYDIIVPTGYMVEIMIAEDLLEPIDVSAMPNFANMSETFLNPPYDPGNQFSVPYQWGTIGLFYNRTVVGRDLTSWNDLFEYEGRVAWLEDMRALLGVGLLMNGLEPNASDPADIETARDYLIANGENVVAIVQGDSKTLLQNGEVDIAIDYPGNTFQLLALCECEDYAYVIPEEGTVLWADNVAIPADAPNPELAQVFMDYLMHPQVSADISNYTAYGSPNQAALDLGLIDEAILNNPAIYPPQAILDRSFFITAIPETEVAYNNAWEEIKIALGR